MENNTLIFLSFWAINGELNLDRLKEQLDRMKECGIQGTIFHPRYYPGKPEYMSREYLDILSEIILTAKDLGLEFWIYDENGWPSGSADGHVLENFPDSRCEWLEYNEGKVVRKSRPGINTFERKQVEYFIEYTYEGYKRGLYPEAFAYVTGFFSDEVGFLDGHGASMDMGGIPWCKEAALRYEKTYGEPFEKISHLLFAEEEGCQEVRSRYWQMLSDILAESFYDSVNNWCNKNGKRYTAHLKGEENLFFQTSCSGSAFRCLSAVNMPAVDALERYSGNHYYPRVASSVSRQFSDGQCLAEAAGGSGWGYSPENLSAYVDWLAESGINRIAFHLWQYEKNSHSVRDWPPDIPCGLTWRKAFASILGKLREKWKDKIIGQNPILLIAPERGVMAEFNPKEAMLINEHNGAGTPDSNAGRISRNFEEFVEHCYSMGLRFDVSSERLVEEYGYVDKGQFYLGKCAYEAVICGNGALFLLNSVCADIKNAGIWYEADEWIWRYAHHGGNQILLENKKIELPWLPDSRVSQETIKTGWTIRMQDEAQSVCVAGARLEREQRGDFYYYWIPAGIAQECMRSGKIPIEIVTDDKVEESPFVFLEGDFLVKSDNGYQEKDKRQWECEGNFYLTQTEGAAIKTENLTESGFPFCGTYVELESLVYVDAGGTLEVDAKRLHADCIQVFLDNQESGYCWGPSWKLENLSPGIHKARIRLYPSTYNMYGPHHYIEGDRHLTSPMQYSGEKGFADADDAPEFTLIKNWNFVRFGI